MKTLAYKIVTHDQVILPGNFRQLQLDPLVQRMAANIGKVGDIEPPVLRKIPVGLKLLAGCKRMAAHAILKTPVECRIIECADDEEERITISENSERSHDPEKQARDRKLLLAALTKDFTENPPPLEATKRGPRKKASTLAREAAAQIRGVKPATLRVEEYRDRKKNGEIAKPTVEPNLPTLGMPIDMAIQSEAQRAESAMSAIGEMLSQCRSRLRRLMETPCHKARLENFAQQLAEMSVRAKNLTPACLCPHCKGLPRVRPECTLCNVTGYITNDQYTTVSATFLSERDPKVRFQNRVVSVDELMPEPSFIAEIPPEEEKDPWGLG